MADEEEAVALVGVKRGRRWTKRETGRFLDVLAATADVAGAAEAIGRTEAGAYTKRAGDAAFAEGWERALLDGYSRIEMRLVARSLAGGTTETGAPEFDADRALKLLGQWTAKRERADRVIVGTKTMTLADVEASLLKKMLALVKRKEKAR